MSRATSLVSVLGRINPALYDIVFPHGPAISTRSVLGGSAARVADELNPQPLPPKDELLVAAAGVARDIAFTAIGAEAAGHDGASRIVSAAIDEWCGNGRPPIPIPWPGPWPFPFAFESAPHDLDAAAARIVGALNLAAVASRVPHGRVREALAHGADRLLDVALSGASAEAAVAY